MKLVYNLMDHPVTHLQPQVASDLRCDGVTNVRQIWTNKRIMGRMKILLMSKETADGMSAYLIANSYLKDEKTIETWSKVQKGEHKLFIPHCSLFRPETS